MVQEIIVAEISYSSQTDIVIIITDKDITINKYKNNTPNQAVATDAREVPIVNTTRCLSNVS